MRKKPTDIAYKFRRIFPVQLRNLLKQRNITQKELAEKIEVAPQTVSSWVNGDTIPDIDQCKRIARYFKVSYEYLLDGISTRRKENISIGKELGLTDAAIDILKDSNENKPQNIDIINALLNSFNPDIYDFREYNSIISKIATYFNLETDLKYKYSPSINYIYEIEIPNSDIPYATTIKDDLDIEDLLITQNELEILLLQQILDLIKEGKEFYKKNKRS